MSPHPFLLKPMSYTHPVSNVCKSCCEVQSLSFYHCSKCYAWYACYACYTRYETHPSPQVNFVLGVIRVLRVMHVIHVLSFGPLSHIIIILSVMCLMRVMHDILVISPSLYSSKLCLTNTRLQMYKSWYEVQPFSFYHFSMSYVSYAWYAYYTR